MSMPIDDKCKENFDLIKGDKQFRYMICKIQKNEQGERIVIEKLGERGETWADFINSLPDKEFRYCAFDLEFVNNDNQHKFILVNCNWSPDSASIKQRILYATGKEPFRNALNLAGKEVTLSSKAEYTFEEITKEFDK